MLSVQQPPRPPARKEVVRERLCEMIFDGRVPASTRMVQQELATQLGTSVSALREILVELASAGLVQMEQSREFFVGRMDLEKIAETCGGMYRAERGCCDVQCLASARVAGVYLRAAGPDPLFRQFLGVSGNVA